MKILTVCSSPYLSLDPITQLLDEAGLAKGVESKNQSYQQWHEHVFDAYEQDETGLLIEQALKPGKVWQDMAGQLIYANLDKKQWYWSDSKAGWLLDFWNELEPQHRFALIYSPPQIGINQSLLHLDSLEQDKNLESIINSWVNYHLELLRFYRTHQDKCILVNFEDCLAYPNEFIKICKQSLLFNVNEKVSLHVDSIINPMQCIEDELFRFLTKEYPQVEQLYQELKASATAFSSLIEDHPLENEIEDKAYLDAVWKNYKQLQMQQLENTKINLQQEIKTLQDNIEKQESTKEDEAEQQKIEEQLQQNKEYETENELMLLQLHQVQEELEHYFLKYQELEQSVQKNGIIGFIEQKQQSNLPNAQVIQVKPQSEGLSVELINLQWQQQIWSSYRLEIIKESIIYEQITTQAAIRLPLQANDLLPLQTWPPQTADETGAYWLINSVLLEKELTQSSFYPEDITFLYQLIKQLSQWLKTLESEDSIKNNDWNEYYQALDILEMNLEPIFDLQKLK